MEHPDITAAAVTGGLKPEPEPECRCQVCNREIYDFDGYWDFGEGPICETCAYKLFWHKA